ncbi:LPS translocon maturation chaperone LptM [Undibacterium sp. TJN19]|uniref:LPS translocon maturation chaperone LptM n=1 Tax=Undibacterium sp. TJN19 TaxID=3413055 RepID=UPI003BEFE8B2
MRKLIPLIFIMSLLTACGQKGPLILPPKSTQPAATTPAAKPVTTPVAAPITTPITTPITSPNQS